MQFKETIYNERIAGRKKQILSQIERQINTDQRRGVVRGATHKNWLCNNFRNRKN